MAVINNRNINHFLINRIDNIGDVILTLPLCIYLKLLYPDITISFLARNYTRAIVEACPAIDHFIDYDILDQLTENEQVENIRERKIDVILHTFNKSKIAKLAKRAGIPIRIGNTSNNSHFIYCNKLIRLSRGNSHLHEAQQMFLFLQPLGFTHIPTIGTLASYYKDFYKPAAELSTELSAHLLPGKFNLIVHTMSNGHGREWEMDKYAELINQLPLDKFNIIISGSPKEAEILNDWVKKLPPEVINLSGKMTLSQFMTFIYKADGLLASGTGPLHIAAASGIHALGLFPVSKSINALRWAPLGKKAEHIESDSDDLSSISVKMVYEVIVRWLK
ncbi:glycosyltransferase family 9 protein [Mucilaginibacter paludis]|uniref:Glycosyl transferase family 9 n=1 Tax=Mucilaginibacter paludis DSM 18603 TaxID=714943 RepID=H1Y2T0_9SPHI|nr:glycosyltransferase family 9 protein [Mucilaginibacter paludis]EHQ28259.1 glycosyl transferase family 9 [Mucilaginibacter paludis DSM 18603]